MSRAPPLSTGDRQQQAATMRTELIKFFDDINFAGPGSAELCVLHPRQKYKNLLKGFEILKKYGNPVLF